MMIPFIVVVCIIQALPAHGDKVLVSVAKLCFQKNNFTLPNFMAVIKFLSNDGEKQETFSACVMQELGYVDSNGNILNDEIKKTLFRYLPGVTATTIEQCKNEKGNTIPEKCHKFLKCLIINAQKQTKGISKTVT
ncbi:hypothetical protein FQA39_LY13673 [Lamprigera yunnana]|nr:hypothetical protein FQA39_LY13673 [Lamprigera yunnana]